MSNINLTKIREDVYEKSEIVYELTVKVNEDVVYSDYFHSEESLQSEGLRKADHAIEKALDNTVDEAVERLEGLYDI